MRLSVRKPGEPMRVPMGDVVFLLRPLTLALQMEVRGRVRRAGDGKVDPERMEAEVCKAILAGWEGLKDGSGAEVPFGPCPECSGAAASPDKGISGGNGAASACPGCEGSRDCRDWALRAFPYAVWEPLTLAACAPLAAEEEVGKN